MPDELVTVRGDVLVADHDAALALAQKVTAARYPSEPPLRGADLYAGAVLEEIYHLVIANYLERVDADAFESLEAVLSERLGDRFADTLTRFLARFPNPEIAHGRYGPDEYLRRAIDGMPGRHVAIEELWTCHLANANPALRGARALVDDRVLATESAYDELIEVSRSYWRERPGLPGHGGSLFDLLLEPMRAAPDDLEGQLRFAQVRWAPLLGEPFAELVRQLLGAIAVLREAKVSRAPGPPGPPPPSSFGIRARAGAGGAEVRFSPDASWMPQVVLLAKSPYVWLGQLAREYDREIERLDAIPEEALAELARRGFNALWLIGLWERSSASRTIKRLRGQADAVASAYALRDYVIADDLGGPEALDRLRERAARHGIRLASDMVPNHVGIDARWVIEHPDWFVQVDRPPYPAYTFEGPDLSEHPDVAIVLEDHYYDDSDAAVVFKRIDRHTGDTTFIYHGNDGTTMPWNDTAQLDYLRAEVREAVIGTILHVARQFPIIRFDAAMTLAKEHVRRLWYPPEGEAGGIPSRARYGAMSDDAFEAAMPHEFWREVVDRVAREVPDTLLLAEAFWMMEGYFVRTLGMHRVYNSAFMHMLKGESNGEHRALVKEVLAFDPQVLKRFVNFLNNPDEETARAQFGDGDKYFAAATLLTTMPGLPMFGHGQVEGFSEKYGMEYRRAKVDETPDANLLERHEREIFPLMHRRWQFAEVERFRLFDVIGDDGGVREDVYAYTNVVRGAVSLVLVNNRYERSSGRIHVSAPFVAVAGETPRTERLHEALDLHGGARRFLVMRALASGLTYLHASKSVADHGLPVTCEGFAARVYLDVHELVDHDGALARLAERLDGAGTPSLVDALDDDRLGDVHESFLALVDALEAGGPAAARLQADAFARFARAGPVSVAQPLRAPARGATGRIATTYGAGVMRAALAVHALTHASWPLEAWRGLRLDRALRHDLARRELDLAAVAAVPAALAHLRSAGVISARRWLASLVADPDVGDGLGRHEHGGETWFRREGVGAVADVTAAALRCAAPGAGAARRITAWRNAVDEAMAASGYLVREAIAAPDEVVEPRRPRAAAAARKGTGRQRRRRAGRPPKR
ncbi:alpha-amylase family glycosyl hydrolase [soil metagenome]